MNPGLIFFGIVLSILISLLSPYIDKRMKEYAGKSKVLIVCLVALIAAILDYFFGNSFWQTLFTIGGTAFSYYAILNKAILEADPIKEWADRQINKV